MQRRSEIMQRRNIASTSTASPCRWSQFVRTNYFKETVPQTLCWSQMQKKHNVVLSGIFAQILDCTWNTLSGLMVRAGFIPPIFGVSFWNVLFELCSAGSSSVFLLERQFIVCQISDIELPVYCLPFLMRNLLSVFVVVPPIVPLLE